MVSTIMWNKVYLVGRVFIDMLIDESVQITCLLLCTR